MLPYEVQSETWQGLKFIEVLVLVGAPLELATIEVCQSCMINFRGFYPRLTSCIDIVNGN